MDNNNTNNPQDDKYSNYSYGSNRDDNSGNGPRTYNAPDSDSFNQGNDQNGSYGYNNGGYDNNGYNNGGYNNNGYNNGGYGNNGYDNNGYDSRPPVSYGTATASMICGILSIVFSCCYGIGIVPGIIAIILSCNFKKKNGTGTGQSLAGLICGIIGSIFSILFIIYIVYVVYVIHAAGADLLNILSEFSELSN